MNVLNKFTFRSLKLNKKRTIVTIIGIMLSSALVCGLVGLVSSFQQTLINMVVDSVGNYHTRFYDVPKDEIEKIQNDDSISQSFLTSEVGIAYLEDSKNDYKPYVSVLEYDKNAFFNNGLKLIEGRLPQSDSELLIPEHINDNGRVGYKVGDKVTFDIGTRVKEDGTILSSNESYMIYDEENSLSYNEKIIEPASKTYTIVGIIKRPDYSIEKYSSACYTVITHMKEIPKNVDISVLYKEPTSYIENNNRILGVDDTKNICESDEDKTQKIGKYETYVNRELLRYQGTMSNTALNVLYGIATVVMVIIVVSSVFVIRNSFSISVAEKNRQYGMLSSIGATKKQIRKSVLFEGFLIGIIAIPLGILSGVIAIIVLLEVVNYLLEYSLGGMKFVYSLPMIPVLISVAISSITIYLSCLIPAYKASKITPIDAIRGNDDVKIKSKKIKSSKYIKKLFGIGGVIASKNLKRCRRKYTTTVISIVISIVIFISLSSFIHYGNKTSDLYYTELSFNMIVEDNNIELYKDILKFDDISDYAYYYETSTPVDEKYCSDFWKEMFNKQDNDPNISIEVCNNEYFKKYIKSLGISEENYDKGAILIDEVMKYNEDGTKVLKSIYNLNEGNTMDIKVGNKSSVKILKKTDQRPMGYEETYMEGGILVVSEDFVDDISEFNLSSLYINSSNATKLENTINDLSKQNMDKYGTINVLNFETMVEAQNRMVLVIAIFLYGFITVITLIGVTNIFNTITTNMILRSKEFAMLKSIGMTKKEFNKMIRLESILYGLKSLFIGIPIGVFGSYMMYKSFAENIDTGYTLPLDAILISIIFVFVIVGTTMKYSLNKINKQNIIETIRNDNI